MDMELRVLDAELESNEDGSMTVSGYVNKTGKRSNVLGVTRKFVEKIAPGAFNRAIMNSQRDIDFLAEHDNKKILASTRNGSLELKEDEQGLFMSATIAPTSWGKDYFELIKAGILRNMSFGFRSVKDSWRGISPGLYERVIEELELFEVSVVRDPAYSQSTIAARGIDLVEDVEIPAELEEEQRKMDEKLTEILEKLSSFEERFNSLNDELKELRAAQEKALEVREEQAQESEKSEEQSEEQAQEQVDEENRAETPKKKDKEEDSEEVSDESSEDSDDSEGDDKEDEDDEDEDDEADEEVEKEKEQKRSKDLTAKLAEFRNRLASLK